MKGCAVILLIEDNIEELYALEKGLTAGGIENPVRIARRVSEALCYLQGVGVYADRAVYPLPVLIMIDLFLKPADAAAQLLVQIRRFPETRDIPVIVLGSAAAPDAMVQRLFDLGANGYFGKRDDLGKIVELIHGLDLVESMRETVPGEPAASAGSAID